MRTFRELFSLDLRSISVFRILLALVLLIDLGIRADYLEAWYTDFGLLPVAAARILHAEWSIHMLSGSLGYEIFLFGLAALAAPCLGFGFHSRIAIVASYVLGVSLIHRNPAVQGGTAWTMTLILFWSLWLPLGARWSVDSLRRPVPNDEASKAPQNHLLFSIATVVFVGQIILIYPMLVWGKLSNPCCWPTLRAVHMIVAADRTASWATPYLRRLPWTHKPLTFAALVSEGIVPFLAFSPLNTQRLRTLAVFAMMFFHGVALPSILDLGFTFPGMFVALWSLLLPRARAWIEARVPDFGSFLSRTSRAFHAIVDRIPPAKETKAPWRASALAVRLGRIATAVASIFIGLCFGVVVFESASKVVGHAKILPKFIMRAEKIIGVQQAWGLYSTVPKNRAFSYVAELDNGTRVDLFRGGAPVDWEHLRPKPSSSHEVKYQTNLTTEGDSILPFFVAYLARKWDRAHPKRPVAAIDIVEVMRPKGSFRRKLLWHREFSPTVIPDLNHDWHARAFKVHEEGRVQIVLASPDLTERVCKTKKSVAGLSCNPDTEDRLLRPFTRIEGTPFLAPAEPLAAFAEAKAPFAVECTLKIVGKTPKPKVRFDRDTPWFETTDDWAVGELSACSPLLSFDGPSMAKESPEKPEKNTSPKRKSKAKKLRAKKKKKSKCPSEPCEP